MQDITLQNSQAGVAQTAGFFVTGNEAKHEGV
jgi:hypothetical protein